MASLGRDRFAPPNGAPFFGRANDPALNLQAGLQASEMVAHGLPRTPPDGDSRTATRVIAIAGLDSAEGLQPRATLRRLVRFKREFGRSKRQGVMNEACLRSLLLNVTLERKWGCGSAATRGRTDR
jgi:hypothetical protein